MTEDEFDDVLHGLTPEQAVEARAVLDELADSRRAAAMIEGHIVSLLARLGRLSDAQAASAAHSRAREDARRSFAAQAAIALRVGPGDARAQLAMAEQIHDDCPATLAALESGDLSLRHAEQVVKAGLNLDPGGKASLDQGAAALGTERTSRQLGTVLKKRAADLDARSFHEKHAEARARRHITMRDLDDGMSELILHGPTLEVRSVFDRIDQMAREVKKDRLRARRAYEREHGRLPEEGWTAPVSGGIDGTDPLTIAASDQRTLPQVRTDIFLDVLLTAQPAGHELHTAGFGAALDTIRANVQVTIPVATLIDPRRAAAWMDDGTLIDPETARILAGSAPGWERIFTRPEDGTIAAVDHYRPTSAQRRAVMARDMTCRLPGCTVAARRCDIDHGHDYARGGPTAVENLEALCPAHHQMKHQAGWKVRQVAGGVIEFTTPTGHTVTDDPISRVFFQESPAAAQCERDEIAREHAVADNARRAQDRADARRSARPPRARWPHRSNESPNGARAAFDEPEVRVILGPDGDLVETCDAWLDQDDFLDMLRSGRIRDPHPEPR